MNDRRKHAKKNLNFFFIYRNGESSRKYDDKDEKVKMNINTKRERYK